MTMLGQKVLIAHLSDRDSMDTLAREGLAPEIIPTEELRKVYLFAIDYFHRSGRVRAPSVDVLQTEFGELFNDLDIDLEEPDDSVEWAIDDLKGTYVHKKASAFNKAFAQAMADGDTADRVEILSEHANELVSLSMSMESHESRVDAREALSERVQAYETRVLEGGVRRGLSFGLDLIDDYTFGIHPGELAVLAAGPKTGKSYFLDLVALRAWQAGKALVLFTLENSVEMTLDRIACLAMAVDSTLWQRGECTPEEVERVGRWVSEVEEAETPLWILQPEMGKRGAEQMVREAQLRGADVLLIDQLSHIESDMAASTPKTYQIQAITQTIKSMISTGRDRMPCLLAHQISRDGMRTAKKVGYLSMEDLADSASVERTADWVFSLYQSHDERIAGQAKFQTLAARRMAPKHFQMRWNVDMGMVSAAREMTLEQA